VLYFRYGDMEIKKTDTNIYYSTILSLYANTEKTTDSKADIR